MRTQSQKRKSKWGENLLKGAFIQKKIQRPEKKVIRTFLFNQCWLQKLARLDLLISIGNQYFEIGNNKISNVLYTFLYITASSRCCSNCDKNVSFSLCSKQMSVFFIPYFYDETAVLFLISIQGFWGFELDWFLRSVKCLRERKSFLLNLTFWLVRHTLGQNIESIVWFWKPSLIQIRSIGA